MSELNISILASVEHNMVRRRKCRKVVYKRRDLSAFFNFFQVRGFYHTVNVLHDMRLENPAAQSGEALVQ